MTPEALALLPLQGSEELEEEKVEEVVVEEAEVEEEENVVKVGVEVTIEVMLMEEEEEEVKEVEEVGLEEEEAEEEEVVVDKMDGEQRERRRVAGSGEEKEDLSQGGNDQSST
ncbi:unnamed protein product [Boreogadus saida]